MNKTAVIIFYFLLIGALTVAAKRKRVTKFHKVPLYRSLEQLEDITTDMLEDQPEVSSQPKVFLVKPRKSEADEGRFFKHILLFKTLMQPSSSNIVRPGFYPPYVIIGNRPGNITNINNNTLINAPTPAPAAAAAASPTTTVTATAGTGTGTGTAGGGLGGRIVYVRDSEALPYPMPTQVYQQRQQEMPQVVYSAPFNGGNQNKRRRIRFGNGNGNVYRNPNRKSNNPFSTFANRLRKVQFF